MITIKTQGRINVYQNREDMLLAYLRENARDDIVNVYINDSMGLCLNVRVYFENSYYDDTIDITFVMGWLWGKIK